VARAAAKEAKMFVASECPLAGEHIVQGMHKLEGATVTVEDSVHPIELFAKAYGL
jgi:glycerol-3-phosphate dehydrogenase subunit C